MAMQRATEVHVAYGILLLLLVSCCVSCAALHVQPEDSDAPSDSHRRRLLRNKHNDFQHLRILAFGTSRTYGVGVNSPYKAFPYLLSRNNTKNVSMKASGPQYSALCTQTVVGNDDALYDVILFEYNLLADEYLEILAKRLRARFPQAIMIFMCIWLPFQFKHIPSNKAVLPLIHERFGTLNQEKKTAKEMLANLVEGTQAQDWKFNEREDKKALLERIASRVGGCVYHMPRPENVIEALTHYSRYYTPDMNHFTNAGHRFFQQEMVKLLHDLNAGERTHQLGTWVDTDSCQLWYDTGIIPDSAPHEAPNVNFLSTRYALEFPTIDNYLGFKNPFEDRPVFVWIDFMAGSPAGQYPKSLVRFAGSAEVEIDPRLRGSGTLHVMKHARIGMLNPGERVNLFIESIDKEADNDFRVVGMIYTTIQVQDGFEVE